MKAIISWAINGASVRFIENDGEKIIKEDRVFEFDDEKGFGGLTSMFWEICNHYGWDGDRGRYSKERINFSLVHGDKYECSDKECQICKAAEYDEA